MTETYEAEYLCSNCRTMRKMKIPKGTRLRKFIGRNKCETCGC